MAYLTREDLDNIVKDGCACSGCTAGKNHSEPLYIHARCHVEAKLEVAYYDGILTILCAECKSKVFSVAVARKK